MPALVKDQAIVTKHIRNVRGGSQPILVEASDGLTYIAKFPNSLQGPNLLFNESAGSELYRACGLAVPSWKPLVVTESFLDKNPDCWMQSAQGHLRPTPGLCFGSHFLGTGGARLLEILPESSHRNIRKRTSFWLAWLIDVCADHVDNRQAVFVEGAKGWLYAFFIDHGHLFGGPKADRQQDFYAIHYLDPRIYPEVSPEELLEMLNVVRDLDADSLWQRVTKTIPSDWKQASALDRFACCLQRLADPHLVQYLLKTIIDSNPRGKRRLGSHRSEQVPAVGVMRNRLPDAGPDNRRVRSRACGCA